MRLRRWELVSSDHDGRVIGTRRFFLRRTALSCKSYLDRTATGEHDYLTPVPAEIGPLFTTEVRRG